MKYRFKKFNASIARKHSFSKNKIPTTSEWKLFINNLVKNGDVSLETKGYYRFNIRSKIKEFISYDFIIQFLKRNYSCENQSTFPASSSRKNFSPKVKPSSEEWMTYLDDLSHDMVLESLGVIEKTKKFKIIQ